MTLSVEFLLRVYMLFIAQCQIIEAGKSHDDTIHQRVEVTHIHRLKLTCHASLQPEQSEPVAIGVDLQF